MRNLKTKLLICAFSLTGLMLGDLSGFAQTRVYGCSYDATGNRINRRFIQLKSGPESIGEKPANPEKPIEETLGDHVIRIYPNPTKGSLTLFIGGCKQDEIPVYRVYNLMGACVLEGKSAKESTTLELGKQPAGLYVLRLMIGNDQTEWKIIKE